MKARLPSIAAMLLLSATAQAQWLNYKTPGTPRTADGKLDLTAPAPRTPDGKPDLSGLWMTQGIYIGDITKDLKQGSSSPGLRSFKSTADRPMARTIRHGNASLEAFRDRPRSLIRSRLSTPPAW